MDAEARVMAVVWQRNEATVAEVVADPKKKRAATYSTVPTILRILEAKGYVSHEKWDGRSSISPAWTNARRVAERSGTS